jgi:hypothetical protein
MSTKGGKISSKTSAIRTGIRGNPSADGYGARNPGDEDHRRQDPKQLHHALEPGLDPEDQTAKP